jgi:hypothetical protein
MDFIKRSFIYDIRSGNFGEWRRSMIRYDLKCSGDHAFDAWFRDSAAFSALKAAGEVTCPLCGDARVEKVLMAPAIGRSRRDARPAEAAPAEAPAPTPALSAPPQSPVHAALVALRQRLEQEATYVGRRFAAEARRLHDEGADETPIWGEATAEEAASLLDEGIAVAPLPPLPRRDD